MDIPKTNYLFQKSARSMKPRFHVSLMDRYILQEITLPFLFGVGAFSSIGVSVGALFELIREVTESGLPIWQAIQIFGLRLPEFIVLAFPMSTLLATMMSYSRLSADSEMIALRGCGVSVRRIILPALVFSIFVTGLTFTFNELITPTANYQAAITLDRALDSETPPFRERNILYREFQEAHDDAGEQEMSRLFYARKYDGSQMYDLTVLDYSQTGLSQIVSAESAIFDPQENIWNFYNGTIYGVTPDGTFRRISNFKSQALELPSTPFDIANSTRKDEEMNIAQASKYLRTIARETGDTDLIRTWEIRIQQKYALPFVCVVFGLVGSVLGASPQRTGKATSFGISVIIIFGYYLFAFICNALGEVGFFSPVLSAWIPNLAFLGVGVYLLRKVSN